MADYTVAGVHQINKWLWEKLRIFEYKPGTKAFKDYEDSGNPNGYTITPIVPGHQWPQMSDITKNRSPYIVYNYITSGSSSDWWVTREQCAYVIYDSDEKRLRGIQAYMVDLLRRVDWTARDLNFSIEVSNDFDFDFKFVQLTSSSGPDEFKVTTEQNLQGSMVVIDYEYTVDMHSPKGSAEGNGMRV